MPSASSLSLLPTIQEASSDLSKSKPTSSKSTRRCRPRRLNLFPHALHKFSPFSSTSQPQRRHSLHLRPHAKHKRHQAHSSLPGIPPTSRRTFTSPITKPRLLLGIRLCLTRCARRHLHRRTRRDGGHGSPSASCRWRQLPALGVLSMFPFGLGPISRGVDRRFLDDLERRKRGDGKLVLKSFTWQR
jgi:hypothetical protein